MLVQIERGRERRYFLHSMNMYALYGICVHNLQVTNLPNKWVNISNRWVMLASSDDSLGPLAAMLATVDRGWVSSLAKYGENGPETQP